MKKLIEIPSLQNKYLMDLMVCCRITAHTKEVSQNLKKLEQADSFTAKVAFGGLTTFVELFGGGGVKNHMHVNVLTRQSRWKKRDSLFPISRVRMELAKFIGTKANVNIIGKFFPRVNDLPPHGLIRSAMVNSKKGGLLVRQTAQTLSIGDGPVSEISWSLREASHFVQVGLDIETKMVIDSSYLTECERFVLEAFSSLILQEKPDATSHQ